VAILAFGGGVGPDQREKGPHVVFPDFSAVLPGAGRVAVLAILAHASLVKIRVAIGTGLPHTIKFKILMAGPAAHVPVGLGEGELGFLVVENDVGCVDRPVFCVVALAAVPLHGSAMRTLRGAGKLGRQVRTRQKNP
jgi:hypothetical protein